MGLATAPVAEAGAGGVLDLAELMAAADRALYRAKHHGRNRVDGMDVRKGAFRVVPTAMAGMGRLP